MKASFDSVRKSLAAEFNELTATELDAAQKEILVRMRQTIGCLLCMYDPASQPEDCNCLVPEVLLNDVEVS